MMLSIDSYVRRGRHWLRKFSFDPRFHTALRAAAHLISGFVLSAASLGNRAMPLALGLVCACGGWSAALAAAGGCLGYLLFWGAAGVQGTAWLALGLIAAVFLGDRPLGRKTALLMPALAALIVSATGVAFQVFLHDAAPVAYFLLRVVLAAGAAALFSQVLRGRNPILEWLTCGAAVLALAQLAISPWGNLGCLAAGALAAAGAFPAVALGGLALDLAQITAVPMAAVMCLAYLTRFLPRYPKWLPSAAPALTYLLVMGLCGQLDLHPLPMLALGGVAGYFLPSPSKIAHRRGETGVAQVRLEMAAGVLAQAEQLLLETPQPPVDEAALVQRAAERACGGCPCRKSCKDAERIGQLPAPILHKPLLTPEELPIVCRKSGRFLAELHRSQEQLRSIRADRERQREYRAAVVQQFQFLSSYLQEMSDQLSRRPDTPKPAFEPEVSVYGNRPKEDNGDRLLAFAGTGCRYYVLLCDGMGTGLGAVQDGKTAGTMLRQLLTAGYPAPYALRSLNSLCALRERAGAVAVDLAEIELDTGKSVLYKWGAAPSYLISKIGAEKIGTAGPPPGLSVTDYREATERLSLRRGEILVLVSDGVGEADAMRCCLASVGLTPGEVAAKLVTCNLLSGEDDATIALVRLNPTSLS